MITLEDILSLNMEEFCSEAIKNTWSLEKLQAWSIVKIAQYLEEIAYKEERKLK